MSSEAVDHRATGDIVVVESHHEELAPGDPGSEVLRGLVDVVPTAPQSGHRRPIGVDPG
jgi:hypothetical protein